MKNERSRLLKKGEKNGPGPVVYWMSRDQRAGDNWALLYAQELARRQNVPLAIVFCLSPKFLDATLRHYDFMLRGLRELERKCNSLDMAFFLLTGEPQTEIPAFIERNSVGTLVTDFDPLKIKKRWKKLISERIDIPFFEVDAHNLVPCWIASPKQEYAARTFRPKIHRLLPEYLDEFPEPSPQKISWKGEKPRNDWENIYSALTVDTSVGPVNWITPGENAAQAMLSEFIGERLLRYEEDRNDPNKNVQSNLSPYLHFGQISAQRVALEISGAGVSQEVRDRFLEELIVRRELSDNFCYYNPAYDRFEGFPNWAQATLNKHRGDLREHIYGLEEFEAGATHDELWNSAQKEMVRTGKMHGYMRMYWAKKMLEWSASPEEALEYAICLNDKYELDGRDPNGYTGIAWSIGGVHDRPWPGRPIYGTIRSMSYSRLKSKFHIAGYIARFGEMC